MDIRKKIKESLKKDFNFDLILIQIGFMFEAIEEDAIFLFDEFDLKLQGKGRFVSYDITGFPLSSADIYKEKLDLLGINYCFIEQINDSNNSKIDRVVKFSTIEGAEGLIF